MRDSQGCDPQYIARMPRALLLTFFVALSAGANDRRDMELVGTHALQGRSTSLGSWPTSPAMHILELAGAARGREPALKNPV